MKFATVLSLAAGALAHASVSTDEAASVSLISESAASTSIAAGVTTLVSESSVPSGEPSGEASESITYTTSIVTAITTYCPEATEIVHGSSTYTVTEVRGNLPGWMERQRKRAGLAVAEDGLKRRRTKPQP